MEAVEVGDWVSRVWWACLPGFVLGDGGPKLGWVSWLDRYVCCARRLADAVAYCYSKLPIRHAARSLFHVIAKYEREVIGRVRVNAANCQCYSRQPVR